MKITIAFNLQRLWNFYKEGKFGIVSAYGNFSKKENQERGDKLKKMVRDLGYGYKEMRGVWKGEEGVTFEYPLFIPKLSAKDAKALGKEFDQEAVIFAESPEKVILFDTKNDKEVMTFTKLETEGKDVWESYSDLKGKKFRFSEVEWLMPFADPTKASSMKCFVAMAEDSYFKSQYSDFPEREKGEITIKATQKLKV